VLPGERLPDRQLGRRQRAHIGEQEPGAFLHRIGLGRATPRAVRIDDIVIGLLDDAAGLVHQPAVIIAADADLLDEAVGEVGTPVRAMPVDESVAAAHVLVEHEVLAEETDRLDRVGVELARAADRLPITAQIVTHRRAGADLREDIVLFSAEHDRLLEAFRNLIGNGIVGNRLVRRALPERARGCAHAWGGCRARPGGPGNPRATGSCRARLPPTPPPLPPLPPPPPPYP